MTSKAKAVAKLARKMSVDLTSSELKTISDIEYSNATGKQAIKELGAARRILESKARGKITHYREILRIIKQDIFCQKCPKTSRSRSRSRSESPKKKRSRSSKKRPRSSQRRSSSSKKRSPSKKKRSPSKKRANKKTSRSSPRKKKSSRSASREKSSSKRQSRSAKSARGRFVRRLESGQAVLSRKSRPSSPNAARKRQDVFKELLNAKKRVRTHSKSPTKKTPPARIMTRASKAPQQALFAAINNGEFNLRKVSEPGSVKGIPPKQYPRKEGGLVAAFKQQMNKRRDYLSSSKTSASW